MKLWGVNLKVMLVSAQVIGYTLSKFIGIKVISELNPNRRGFWIIVFILTAELSLVLFGLTPQPYNVIWMFVNGLPLGMIWGLVFSYLEGRRTSEILGCGMAISFIVSSGAVKSVGKEFLNKGINQFWMPSLVGVIFLVPLVLSTLVLESIPPPNEDDIKSRTERVAMDNKARLRFLKEFWPGITLWVLFMIALTAYRDFRDNFAPELWAAWGYEDTPSVYTVSEIVVACVICVPIGLFMLIKSHMWTLISYHILIIVGLVVTLICTIICDAGKMSGVIWMVITGIGLYLGYIPFNSIIFDCFLSAFSYKANTGFLMYICDASGYLASVAIYFVKEFAAPQFTWIKFFMELSYYLTIITTVLMALALVYFIIKYKTYTKTAQVKNDECEDIDKEKSPIETSQHDEEKEKSEKSESSSHHSNA